MWAPSHAPWAGSLARALGDPPPAAITAWELGNPSRWGWGWRSRPIAGPPPGHQAVPLMSSEFLIVTQDTKLCSRCKVNRNIPLTFLSNPLIAPDLILQSVVSALRDLEAQIAGLSGKWRGGEVWAVRIYSGRFGVEWRRTMRRVGEE